MNTNLLNILKQIISEQGESILTDPKRLKSFFSDYAKNEQKEERVAFGRCIEMNAYQELKKTRSADERRRVKTALTDQINSKTGVDRTRIAEALDLLEAVLFKTEQQSQGTVCSKCGKELQKEWAICPYCSTPAAKTADKVIDSATQASFEKGKRFFENSDFDTAIAEFTETIRLDPNYAEAYVWRGNAYQRKNQYDTATIKDLNKAIKLDPNNSRAYMLRGYAYQAKGEHDLAIKDSSEAIRLDPNKAESYIPRFLAYQMKGEHDLAIRDINEAIKLDPNASIYYGARAFSYQAKGEFDKTIKDYSEAIRLDPNNAFPYLYRGQVYGQLGQKNQAIHDLEKAISLDSNLYPAKQALQAIRGY